MSRSEGKKAKTASTVTPDNAKKWQVAPVEAEDGTSVGVVERFIFDRETKKIRAVEVKTPPGNLIRYLTYAPEELQVGGKGFLVLGPAWREHLIRELEAQRKAEDEAQLELELTTARILTGEFTQKEKGGIVKSLEDQLRERRRKIEELEGSLSRLPA